MSPLEPDPGPIIRFHKIGEARESCLRYAVIVAKTGPKGSESLVMVRHRERSTWEIPGGRREVGESIDDTALREIVEETGAVEYRLWAMADYSVTYGENESYGRLYSCHIQRLGELPPSEIAEVRLFHSLPDRRHLTYPDIQPYLVKWVMESGSAGYRVQIRPFPCT